MHNGRKSSTHKYDTLTRNHENRVQMQDTEIVFETKDQKFRTILQIYRLLYQNLMENTNQNITINKKIF